MMYCRLRAWEKEAVAVFNWIWNAIFILLFSSTTWNMRILNFRWLFIAMTNDRTMIIIRGFSVKIIFNSYLLKATNCNDQFVRTNTWQPEGCVTNTVINASAISGNMQHAPGNQFAAMGMFCFVFSTMMSVTSTHAWEKEVACRSLEHILLFFSHPKMFFLRPLLLKNPIFDDQTVRVPLQKVWSRKSSEWSDAD